MRKNKLNPKGYAIVLHKLSKIYIDNSQEVVCEFTNYVEKHQAQKMLPEILSEYLLLSNETKKSETIEVESHNQLSEDMINEIKQVFGTNIKINQKQDQDIIGGIRIKLPDKILDATINAQLNSLGRHIGSI